MNSSHRADVIIADGDPTPEQGQLAEMSEPVEAADVAPDPARRFIVLAPTKQAGAEYAENMGIHPVAIVTPRSPHGARGITADEIIEADGLTATEHTDLMTEVMPALYTTREAV
ncbi:hypothetical protein [Microbacterium sp. AR7-10]|uniref:hypothetical protein n=1 Tax=Microbacterium sp. AR7-10 TaxID=1891970 RepID=UPI000A57C261|nr:hypothetical protein [Microbacterium sp. AR7-10]